MLGGALGYERGGVTGIRIGIQSEEESECCSKDNEKDDTKRNCGNNNKEDTRKNNINLDYDNKKKLTVGNEITYEENKKIPVGNEK